MAGHARIHGGSSLRALVQNQKRQRIASSSSTSSTSSSSEPLGALILSGSSPSFLGVGISGTRSMVSFEDMNGGNMSERSFLRAFDPDDRGDDELDEYFRQPEKKRRLTTDQVEFLEKSFEVENKLEPDRKIQLAKDVGLQPRQVAIWFQNRRARWKTKQLEKDYHTLQSSYSSLKADYDNLQEDKEKLKAEVLQLASKLLLKKKGRGLITNPGMTTLIRKPNDDEGSKVSNAVGSKQQQDLSSAKSGAFQSDSPPPIDGGGQSASLLEPEPDNAVFEPDQSDLSQEEEGDLSKSLLPPMIFPKIEDAEYPYPSTGSCNYGFPVEDHNAFWSWSY